MRHLLLILRFYRSSMLLFCCLVTLALAYTATRVPPWLVPVLLLFKLGLYPLLLYVFIVPRFRDEFFYYRNLGIRRRWLLGVSCGVDFLICCLLVKLTLLFV